MRSEGLPAAASTNCCWEAKRRVAFSMCCVPKRLQRQGPGAVPGCTNTLPRSRVLLFRSVQSAYR